MEFSDQDLRTVLNRALRSVVIAVLLGIPIVWVAWGWQSMLMFVIGGAIAATGILEWRQLMAAVLVRLDSVGPDVAGPDVAGPDVAGPDVAGPDVAGAQNQAVPRSKPRPLGPVLFWFFVRLAAVAAVLYVSLRSLDGKVAALIVGIVLGLVALFIEAFRLLRGWAA